MDQQKLLDLILIQLERVLPFDRATIFLRLGGKLTIGAHRGREIQLPERFLEAGNIPRNIAALMKEQRPMMVADTTINPDWIVFPGGEFIRCWLGLPLVTKDNLIGLLLLDKDEPYFYTEEDMALALAFANQAAIAIDNSYLYQETQQYMTNLELLVSERTRDLGALYEITAIASQYLDLQETFDRITSVIIESLQCTAVSIHIVDDTGNALRLVSQRNMAPQLLEFVRVQPLQSSIGEVLKSDEPVMYLHPPSVSDLSDVPLPESSTYGIAAPIRVKGQDLGVLGIGYERVEAPTREDIALLASISDHIGVAIENARLREQSEQYAVIEERDRLARDLHDSATQSLFSLTLFAAAAREYLRNGQLNLVNTHLDELETTALQTHKEMRLLLYKLRPKILEEVGLEEALRQRMQLVEFRSGILGEFTSNLTSSLPFAVEETLFQVANEALNNTLKHSGADSVSIDISTDSDQVKMSIKDNGQGFSTENSGFSAGMGMEIMEARVQEMNGTFRYYSHLDQGTTIKIQIPLESIDTDNGR